MIPRCLACFLILFTLNASGQSWKMHYDSAVQAYQNQQYEKTLSEAVQAYALTSDTRYKAYTLQLLTAVCIQTHQTEKGLKWVEEEINLFLQTEGISKSYANALHKQVMFL